MEYILTNKTNKNIAIILISFCYINMTKHWYLKYEHILIILFLQEL